MNPTIVAATEGLQQNNYLSVALLTALVYDYVLTLPNEIDYIWNKRWTLVSTLFLLVRYCGICVLLILTLMWSSLLPGPVKAFLGEILYFVSIWSFVVWIGAADLVMMLRVWAIYNRSRLILWVLVVFWVLEIIPSILTGIMYPYYITVGVTQVANLTYCGVTSASVTWAKVAATFEILNGGVIFILVTSQFVKRALEMHRVTNKWHFNRYMSLFAGQSVLYYLCIIIFNRTAILIASGRLQTEGWGALIQMLIEYLSFALTPRFIMSVRALHPRESDINQGRGTDARLGLSGSHHGDRGISIMLDTRQDDIEVIELDVELPREEWRISMGNNHGC